MPAKNNPWDWLWAMERWLECQSSIDYELGPLTFAITVYHDRQLKDKKHRRYPPRGVWVKQTAKKYFWYPTPHEVRPCCWGVKPPDLRYPWVYQRHCRSARHVAMLFNVDERELVRCTSSRRFQKRCSSCKRFISADLEKCGPCLYRERLDREAA